MTIIFKNQYFIAIVGATIIAGSLYYSESYAQTNIRLAGDGSVDGNLDVGGTISSPTIGSLQSQLTALPDGSGSQTTVRQTSVPLTSSSGPISHTIISESETFEISPTKIREIEIIKILEMFPGNPVLRVISVICDKENPTSGTTATPLIKCTVKQEIVTTPTNSLPAPDP
jgi:hypothetical protein